MNWPLWSASRSADGVVGRDRDRGAVVVGNGDGRRQVGGGAVERDLRIAAGDAGQRDHDGLVGLDEVVVDDAADVDHRRGLAGQDRHGAGQRRVVGAAGGACRPTDVADHGVGRARLGQADGELAVVGRRLARPCASLAAIETVALSLSAMVTVAVGRRGASSVICGSPLVTLVSVTTTVSLASTSVVVDDAADVDGGRGLAGQDRHGAGQRRVVGAAGGACRRPCS